MGREEFVAKTQEWKDEYEKVILSQLSEMGASIDNDRLRFTMNEPSDRRFLKTSRGKLGRRGSTH